MTGLGRFVCALFAAAALGSAVQSTDPTPPTTANSPTAEQLVRDLGSPVFTVREKATSALWKLGEKSRPALEIAVNSGDAEVAQRARDVLDKLDSGLLPDTPPAVLNQFREFRSGLLEKQHTAVVEMVRLGEPGWQALRRLLARESYSESRDGLFETLAYTLRCEAPKLIVAGQLDRAEAMLSLNTLGSSDAGLMDYALFVKMRGRSEQAIAELERREKHSKALVFALRAAGHVDRAKAVAAEVAKAETSFRTTYDSLLEDIGAWSELADRSEAFANSPVGLRLFRLRQAGRTKEAEALANQQKDDLSGESGVDTATLALLLNDRSLEGIERLRNRHSAPHILADMLAGRMEFRAALDLVAGNARLDAATDEERAALRRLYASRRGRLLWQLGQRDAAAQVFGQAFEQIKASGETSSSALTQLIRAEVRTGRFDLACEHLGGALAANEAEGFRALPTQRQDGFEVLFDADADAALFWWQVLRQRKPANESAGAAMAQVRRLLTGSSEKAELEAAIKAARNAGVPAERTAPSVAAVLRAAGRTDEAIAVLSELADKTPVKLEDDEDRAARQYGRGSRSWVFGTDEQFRFWLELGDLLMEQNRYREAADRLDQGWKRYPDNPILLYLSGRALVKAGDEAAGRKRIDHSHWVALGNARLRGRFLEELVTRGFIADVRRERELVRESGWVSELFIGNVWNQVGRASALLKDFDTAAGANRRAIHYLLRTPGVTYVEGHAYLTVPQAVRAYNARALLAAGKVDEAVALAKECLTVMPGNSDLAIGLVPELDKRGRTKDADELFQLVWNAYAKVIRENPESAWARYSAAWLAAGCRRELEKGLDLAKKAAELEPGMKNYQEAVAELHFRRGEREQALSVMTKLSAGDRRSYHYKRQLDRYRTADAASPLPDSEDD